ncbi:N-acyl-L-amino acid amidohydrolase-like protein, partial [Reticulomyxa filosa]
MHGSVKFVFQPAEEGGDGAKRMIEEGVLENPHVDQVYGLHVWSYVKFGAILCRKGELMAGSGFFRIAIKGVGRHAAVPNGTNDVVVAISQLTLQLHSIVPRNLSRPCTNKSISLFFFFFFLKKKYICIYFHFFVCLFVCIYETKIIALDSAVLTVGKVTSGYRANIIADEGVLEGTIRFLRKDVYETLVQRITEICKGIEASYGVTVTLEWPYIYDPPTTNHQSGVELVRRAAKQTLPRGFQECPPTMAAEDFAYFLQQRPGAFFFVGCGVEGEQIVPHHHPSFQVDERCLLVGCQMMVTLVLFIFCVGVTDSKGQISHNDRLQCYKDSKPRLYREPKRDTRDTKDYMSKSVISPIVHFVWCFQYKVFILPFGHKNICFLNLRWTFFFFLPFKHK